MTTFFFAGCSRDRQSIHLETPNQTRVSIRIIISVAKYKETNQREQEEEEKKTAPTDLIWNIQLLYGVFHNVICTFQWHAMEKNSKCTKKRFRSGTKAISSDSVVVVVQSLSRCHSHLI